MVKHIVCYKFKDNSRENLDRATEALLSMRFNVPQVCPSRRARIL